MKAPERLKLTVKKEKSDRPPLDGWFSPGMWKKLKNYYHTNDDDVVFVELGLDFRGVRMDPGPGFNNLNTILFPITPIGNMESGFVVRKIGDKLFEDEWGTQITLDRKGENWFYHYHPFRDKNNFKGHMFPTLDEPIRFARAEKLVKYWEPNYVVYTMINNFFKQSWLLRGLEDFMMDLYLDRDFVERLLDRLYQYKLRKVKRFIDIGVNIIELCGDIGAQNSMMISPDIWREIFKPRLSSLISETKRDGVYFYFHSDGYIEPIINDLIDIGIDIINPIQPECMEPEVIKKKYGNRVTLHGTISLQQTLAKGKNEDVRREVSSRIDKCGYNGGLIIAPANVVWEDVPIENVLALYDTAKGYYINR